MNTDSPDRDAMWRPLYAMPLPLAMKQRSAIFAEQNARRARQGLWLVVPLLLLAWVLFNALS